MKKILLQLDTDPLPSSFDRVVAVDAGVDEIFSYGGVNPENVTSLVHGAMFTRGVPDLKSTAIFIGGSNIDAGETLLKTINKTFFGPVRVSVMFDSNGSNTTAAAAVLRLKEQLPLEGLKVAVLAGTGPVGMRVAQLLAISDSEVILTSRQMHKAETACQQLKTEFPQTSITPCEFPNKECIQQLAGASAIIACGAAGVQFLTSSQLNELVNLRVAVDINAVPPVGLEGISPQEKAGEHGHFKGYGALAVGSVKMKIHKAAIQQLFTQNDLILGTREIFRLGESLSR